MQNPTKDFKPLDGLPGPFREIRCPLDRSVIAPTRGIGILPPWDRHLACQTAHQTERPMRCLTGRMPIPRFSAEQHYSFIDANTP